MIKCERGRTNLQKMQQKTATNTLWYGECLYLFTLQASVFMGKNYSDNLHSIKNTEDLTMKQMFDISEKLTTEQSDEIYGVKTINWENYSWKYLSLVGDEEVISLQRTKVYVFSDSVLCLGKIHENPQSNMGRTDWRGSKVHRNTEHWIELMVSQWNSSGIFSQYSIRCSSVKKFKSLLLRLGETPENFYRTDYLHVDVQWHLMGIKENEQECESSAQLVSLLAKRFGAGHWSFLGPGSEKTWYSISEDSPQGEWDKNGWEDDGGAGRKRTPSLPSHESIVQSIH